MAVSKDAKVWGALLLLALGVLLMDRAFAFWRNDGRNFQRADGKYRTPDHESGSAFFRRHAVLETMAGAGGGMVCVSVLLLGGTEPSMV